MRRTIEFLIRVALLAIILWVWWRVAALPLSDSANLAVIAGGVLLAFPVVWFGRTMLGSHPSVRRAVWITTLVHFALGFAFGVPIIRAIGTHGDWLGWEIPVPPGIGLVLTAIAGAAFLVTVANLALKGLGAPFFIALSHRLAADWLYARTRNPMALAGLAFFVALGIWFQSLAFVLWVLILFAPALLTFIKVFEERELEIRFGRQYLKYKSRTPMLFPRRLRG